MSGRPAGWIDISRPLHDRMALYPGDAPFRLEGGWHGAYRLSALSMSAHAGTHVDAPAHYFEDGASVDALAPDILCGPALVAPLDALWALPRGVRRLLIRGGRGLSADAAQRIIGAGLVLVGCEGLSIADGANEDVVHRMLLGAGVVLVENIDLSDAPDGACELICLPLRLKGAEAAPARALIRPLEVE